MVVGHVNGRNDLSTDTPNLIADFVRSGGVAQNWSWWAFLITGMCTVFFYAKLWRRSGL